VQSAFLIARGSFARGERLGWRVVAASVLAWFVPDSAFSVWSGFWPNAVLNLLFFVVFALPLAATYRASSMLRAPNPSLHPTCASRLRRPAPGGEPQR